MAVRPSAPLLRLRHILETEAKVSDAAVEFLIVNENGPQLESPADLAKLWDGASARQSAISDVLERLQPPVDKDSFAGRRLLGRLLAAWDYASQDHAGEAKKRAAPEPPAKDTDGTDWPEDRKLSCEKEVHRMCGGLVLPPDQVPCSPIMNRLDRIWRERKQELLQLGKMKTAADYALILRDPQRDEHIASVGTAASLFLRQGAEPFPDTPLVSLEQIMTAINVMSNGWILLGTAMVNSKVRKTDQEVPEKVQEWGISSALAWPTFVRKMAFAALSMGDSEASVVQYVRVRERQTRTAAAVLWAEQGWPWGEAMRKVWEQDLAILWTVTQQSNVYGLQVSIPGITDVHPIPPPTTDRDRRPDRDHERDTRRRLDSAAAGSQGFGKNLHNVKTTDLEPWMCCTAHNGHNGCTKSNKLCPNERLHRCDFRLPDGSLCGSSNHNRIWHQTQEAGKGKHDGKGGGKFGGKGKGKGARRR